MNELSLPPAFLEIPLHKIIDCGALWGEYPVGSENFELVRDLPPTVQLETIVRWEALRILSDNGVQMTSPLGELLTLRTHEHGATPVREASDKIVEEIGRKFNELNPVGSSDVYDLTARSLSLTQIALSLEPKDTIDRLAKYRHHLDSLYALASIPPKTMREKMKIIREHIGNYQVSYRGQWRDTPIDQLSFELNMLEYQYLDDMQLFEGEDAVHHYC